MTRFFSEWSIFNHGFHGLTRMKRNQFVAPKTPGLIRCTNAGAVLKRHSQASFRMLSQKIPRLASQAQPCVFGSEGRATSVEGYSRGIREANGAIWKQASRQACLPESLVRKRRLACPSTALRLWFIRAHPC